MKTYNISVRISKQARKAIKNIIATHEDYKKAFFFKPNTNADSRRRKERIFKRENPDVAFNKNGSIIIVSTTYCESCKNCYYSALITKDGVPKSITTIKNLLK